MKCKNPALLIFEEGGITIFLIICDNQPFQCKKAPILLTFVEKQDILSLALPVTVGGSPFHGGDGCRPQFEREGVANMVTWQELLQFGLFLVALISLVVQAQDKKK